MQNTFQQYPKHMAHPGYRPAIVVKWDPKKQQSEQPQGKAATFPPVVVNNKDQELQYASKGYRPAGVSDEAAYMKSVLGADAPNEYTNIDYPAWRYVMKDDELVSVCVDNEAEEKAKCKGWFRTPDQARAGTAPKEQAAKDARPVGGKGESAKPKTKRTYKRSGKYASKPTTPTPPPAASAESQGETAT